MSLLMDALKRAEASKRPASDDGANGADDDAATVLPAPLALEDFPDPREPAFDATTDLESELELPPRHAPRQSVPPEPPRAAQSTPADAADAQRAKARNVMAIKSAPAPGVWRRRAPFLAISGALCLAGVGAGVYFWNELERLTAPNIGLASTPPSRATPVTPLVAPPPAAPATTVAPPPPEPNPAVPALPVNLRPAPSTATADAAPLPAAVAPQPVTAAERPTPRPAAGADPVFRSSRPRGGEAPRAETTPAGSTQRAFLALNAGDLDAATRHYQEALAADGRNVDALVGLASLAVARGDVASAERHYLKAIEADPKSALAQSGLINLHAAHEPGFAESRLKLLANALPSSSPASGSVLFALGNLYARQSRWNEAQRAYFDAHGADASNPDYTFNLAVALEHLQKSALAIGFYRQALSAAEHRPARFDRQQARERIDVLQTVTR